MFSEELHPIELSPIVWPMNTVAVGGLGLSGQEEHTSTLHTKVRFESKFRFIRIIANHYTETATIAKTGALQGQIFSPHPRF